MPPSVQPVISPAGGISEIFRYQLKGPPGIDVMQLKTLQDWVVERRLRIVPGVSDVLVLGGKTKEFQAEIDLNRMIAHGLTLPQIITAISAGNSNVGGRTIAIGEQSVTVRGIGVVGIAPGHPQHRAHASRTACRCCCPMWPRCRSASCRGSASRDATTSPISSPASS